MTGLHYVVLNSMTFCTSATLCDNVTFSGCVTFCVTFCNSVACCDGFIICDFITTWCFVSLQQFVTVTLCDLHFVDLVSQITSTQHRPKSCSDWNSNTRLFGSKPTFKQLSSWFTDPCHGILIEKFFSTTGAATGNQTRVSRLHVQRADHYTREILILIQPFKHTIPSGFLIHL